ncbi:MAG: acetylesterase [Lachnospiraceae bacterium]|jgi:S-formylglutathione hydrolase FrmB|nr:acetylesterase [Lachnospiraceae bacterium]
MAIMQVSFNARSIERSTTFHAALPNDILPYMTEGNRHYRRAMKTLYLLHGYEGNSWDWLTGAPVAELATRYNLAIIMPSGDNSFYVDGRGDGNGYGSMVGSEIVDYTRKMWGLSDKKEDTFIGGLSMGGYGALILGLKYSETFGKIFGLSSALVTNYIKNMQPGTRDIAHDYDFYARLFGDLTTLDKSESNPEYLVKQKIARGETIAPIYLACGADDFFAKHSRDFKSFMTGQGVDIVHQEKPGDHNWTFWRESLEPAIQWLLQ